jgi:hypothetical protein
MGLGANPDALKWCAAQRERSCCEAWRPWAAQAPLGPNAPALTRRAAALHRYRQAELQHARWAMLGVAGVLAQSVLVPDVFWYDAALHLPAGLGPVNLGSTLAIQFLMMHWVEVRRWQDIRKPGSVSQDPIFSGNKLPAGEVGYPGGIFDPLGFAKGNVAELQTKEIKNGRLAMVRCAPPPLRTCSGAAQRLSLTSFCAFASLPLARRLPSWASSSRRRRWARARSRRWLTTCPTRRTTTG